MKLVKKPSTTPSANADAGATRSEEAVQDPIQKKQRLENDAVKIIKAEVE